MSSYGIVTLYNRNLTWSHMRRLYLMKMTEILRTFISNAKKHPQQQQWNHLQKFNQSRSYINYFQMFHWKRLQLEMCMYMFILISKRKNVSLKTNFKMFISTEDHRFTIQMWCWKEETNFPRNQATQLPIRISVQLKEIIKTKNIEIRAWYDTVSYL